jgi:hypothetical protein
LLKGKVGWIGFFAAQAHSQLRHNDKGFVPVADYYSLKLVQNWLWTLVQFKACRRVGTLSIAGCSLHRIPMEKYLWIT